MDTKKLGVELEMLIGDTFVKSTNDIANALGKHPGEILFEYISLLLWIAAKEASTVLPKESFQPTIDAMFSALLLFNEKTFLKIGNEKTWEDLVHNRFNLYHWAWDAHPPELRIKFEPVADVELSQLTVVHNFVLSCLAGNEDDLRKTEEEYRKLPNYEKNYVAHVGCVLRHYRLFSDRVKSVLSRY